MASHLHTLHAAWSNGNFDGTWRHRVAALPATWCWVPTCPRPPVAMETAWGAPRHGARYRLMLWMHLWNALYNLVPQIQSAFWNKSEIHDQLHDGGAMYRNFKIGIQSLDSSLWKIVRGELHLIDCMHSSFQIVIVFSCWLSISVMLSCSLNIIHQSCSRCSQQLLIAVNHLLILSFG